MTTTRAHDAFPNPQMARLVLGTVDFGSEELIQMWANLLHDVGRRGIRLWLQTTDEAVGSWCERNAAAVIDGGTNPPRGAAAGLVIADRAVALADLAAWDRCNAFAEVGPHGAAMDLTFGALRPFASRFPDLSVRATIGWALVDEQVGDGDGPVETAAPWVRSGFPTDGWLLAAAGFTVDEAVAHRHDPQARQQMREQAVTLAALRGVVLPVVQPGGSYAATP